VYVTSLLRAHSLCGFSLEARVISTDMTLFGACRQVLKPSTATDHNSAGGSSSLIHSAAQLVTYSFSRSVRHFPLSLSAGHLFIPPLSFPIQPLSSSLPIEPLSSSLTQSLSSSLPISPLTSSPIQPLSFPIQPLSFPIQPLSPSLPIQPLSPSLTHSVAQSVT
jgi:hypothetical protein